MTLSILIEWTLRIGFSLLFATSGLLKLRDQRSFAASLPSPFRSNRFDLKIARGVLLLVLPAFEVLLGLLALSSHAKLASNIAIVLMVVFTLYIVHGLLNHREGSCACFGSALPSGFTILTLCRNIAITSLIIAMGFIATRSSIFEADIAGMDSQVLIPVVWTITLVATIGLAVRESFSHGNGATSGTSNYSRSLPESGVQFLLSDQVRHLFQSTTHSALLVFTSTSCRACRPVNALLESARDSDPSASIIHILEVEMAEGSTHKFAWESGKMVVVWMRKDTVEKLFGLAGTPQSGIVIPSKSKFLSSHLGAESVIKSVESAIN